MTGTRTALRRLAALLALLLLAGSAAVRAAPAAAPPLVLAAASLQEALGAVADAWAAQRHPRPTLSFAASSALARQVAAGAPADLFLSADEEWMDDLARRGLLAPGTRADLLGNALVLVAPTDRARPLPVRPGMPLAAAIGDGRLAMADPDAVPAGRYGREALTRLGLWPQVAGRIARAENVRAALALVARGAAPLGIVYATDARAAPGVRVIGTFPAGSHEAIRYPLARLTAARSADAEPFRRFLLGARARAIFRRYGFTAP